jgi:hypothetical protein
MATQRAINLYRKLLRDARTFPVPPVRRKLEYNYREMFDLHRAEPCSAKQEELIDDGEAALRVLKWMRLLPSVCHLLLLPDRKARYDY